MEKVNKVSRIEDGAFQVKINNHYWLHKDLFNGKVLKQQYAVFFELLKDYKQHKSNLYITIEKGFVKNVSDNSQTTNIPKYLQHFYKENKLLYDNYALAIDKFGNFEKDKLDYTTGVSKRIKQLYHKSKFEKNLLEAIQGKQKHLKANLETSKKTVISVPTKQTWRMATGMGKATAYNNGFNFHPVFGIPYLTAQQVKGIVRSFLLREVYFIDPDEDERNNTNKEIVKDKRRKRSAAVEKAAMQDDLFRHLFGSDENASDGKAHKGKVQFMECFPINADFEMALDIMNPHYGDYYNDKPIKVLDEYGYKTETPTPPADYLSPSPIFFLSVKGMQVDFSFWLDEDKSIKDVTKTSTLLDAIADYGFNEDTKLSELVKKLIAEALKTQGIGAKTAVGYGRFETITN